MRQRQRHRNPEPGWALWALAAGLLGAGLLAGDEIVDTVKLLSLEPETRAKVKQLIALCRARGLRLLLGSTRRSEAEQAKAIADGASSTSMSWHLTGRAIDIYVWDPAQKNDAGQVVGGWDMAGKRLDLYRIMHQVWASLGGHGLAFGPYPDGPVRYLTNAKGKKYWDGGHVEWHGPYATALAAWNAEKAA